MNFADIPYFVSEKLQKKIDSLCLKPPHTIFFDSDDTVLCSILIDKFVCRLFDITSLQRYPYVLIIEPENKSIGIEQARSIDTFLALTVPTASECKLHRAVIIKSADCLTTEAQNALLKTLEEPPENTIIILSGIKAKMLSTVLSRAVVLAIPPIKRQEALEYYPNYKTNEVEKMFYISKGRVSLLHSLLVEDDNPEQEPIKNRLEVAKRLLTLPQGKRLLEVDTLSKDRSESEKIIELLALLARFSATKSHDKKAVAIMDACNEALKESKANGNMKLILDTLFMVY